MVTAESNFLTRFEGGRRLRFFLFVDLPSDFSSPLDMNFPVRNHISAFYHAREKS